MNTKLRDDVWCYLSSPCELPELEWSRVDPNWLTCSSVIFGLGNCFTGIDDRADWRCLSFIVDNFISTNTSMLSLFVWFLLWINTLQYCMLMMFPIDGWDYRIDTKPHQTFQVRFLSFCFFCCVFRVFLNGAKLQPLGLVVQQRRTHFPVSLGFLSWRALAHKPNTKQWWWISHSIIWLTNTLL